MDDYKKELILNLFKQGYIDALKKQLPDWYLRHVYNYGITTVEQLYRIAEINCYDVVEMLTMYIGWQNKEDYLRVIRGNVVSADFIDDRVFRDLIHHAQ